MEPFPWEFLLGFLFSQMRLSPSEFWSLTLPEVSIILAFQSQKLPQRLSPIGRDSLSNLMQKFPDKA
ncbi:phage tail assembly chaperone [Lentilitoribacter sp. EG35]|uniref:phage tail assembly chaperone n=1 Tax=Lentilitoribacter sp. EG35 TaxID=3234192 RepID=UPI00345F43FD